MAGGDATHGERNLDQTPTWAVSLVCAVIVIISIILEKVLHHIGEWFRRRNKEHMLEALEKIKCELMILGFISLLLTFGQSYIAQICISEKLAGTMLPCALHHSEDPHGQEYELDDHSEDDSEHHRRLLWIERRSLAASSSTSACKMGQVPLISTHGLHQLHIFIFFLAVFHVVYSAITMKLGKMKIQAWKEWEVEVSQLTEFNEPSRFRLTHETTFVKGHSSFWTKTPVLFYLVCFFRQFFRSVTKPDYLTMRHGFVSVHLSPGSKFNFQKYIKKSLEDDFKVVVGISPLLWTSAVIFLLVNVEGSHAMLWLSIMPLIVVLAVGTKLQSIITQMAIAILDRHAVVQGIPLVQVSDKHFWFGRPHLVLVLIHLTLFQNAFEITYFLWTMYEFGFNSCFHESTPLVVVRVTLGVAVQFMCSYITLPLYALVTQMGTHMKRSIFDEQTSKALKTWQKKAVKSRGEGKTVSLGSPGDSKVDSPKFGKEKIETSDGEVANIIASVDIPENPPGKDSGLDLLTGL
ncbi:hypothetical protein NMG60_11015963 [Bertholletia excelsa]